MNAHVFGCPVYVLDPKLQNGAKFPKFKARSRRGVFAGLSRQHSSLVPMIMNLQTLSMTPQYHVVFDDWFSSVTTEGEVDPESADWNKLFIGSRYNYSFDEEDDVHLNDKWNELLDPIASEHDIRNTMMTREMSRRQRENNTNNNNVPIINNSVPITNNTNMTPSTLSTPISTQQTASGVSTPIRSNATRSAPISSTPISSTPTYVASPYTS
jgi:hypothetical protein